MILLFLEKLKKIDLYTDLREEQEKDLIELWDEKKLDQVVKTKQSSENRNLKTDIVCRYFLEAIETKKYGWFWECPNGGEKCIYRHALPPGFIFKLKEAEEDVPLIPVEQTIEAERKALKGITPVTLEHFLKWKADKKARTEKEKQEEEKKKSENRSGRTVMSGREMFVFNPDLFIDDDEALEENELDQEDEIDSNVPHNIVTVTGTSISLTRVHGSTSEHKEKDEIRTNEKDENEDHNENDKESSSHDQNGNIVEYENENLFLEDDLPSDDDDDDEN